MYRPAQELFAFGGQSIGVPSVSTSLVEDVYLPLIEVPESLSRCLTLNTLTLWNCQVLERIPDLTSIPKLQIDGVPEQLADWEIEQKKKWQEEVRDGKNKGREAAKASHWEAVKKDAKAGTVAGAAVDALTAGKGS